MNHHKLVIVNVFFKCELSASIQPCSWKLLVGGLNNFITNETTSPFIYPFFFQNSEFLLGSSGCWSLSQGLLCKGGACAPPHTHIQTPYEAFFFGLEKTHTRPLHTERTQLEPTEEPSGCEARVLKKTSVLHSLFFIYSYQKKKFRSHLTVIDLTKIIGAVDPQFTTEITVVVPCFILPFLNHIHIILNSSHLVSLKT